MNISFRPATKPDVFHFSAWRYPPPYDVYNLGEPSAADLAYYLDPRYCFYVMLDAAGAVVAYCSFGADGQVPGGTTVRMPWISGWGCAWSSLAKGGELGM